jgi:SAM-dependent methyltransferase
MTEKRKTYLLVPAGGRGEGMGHLMRCLSLYRKLDGKTTLCTAFLDGAARALVKTLGVARMEVRHLPRPTEKWDIVFMDTRRSSLDELRSFSRHGTVCGMDSGGEARDYASYVIDSIPALSGRTEPNISSLSFLDLPPRVKRRTVSPHARVLVSFGGEDERDLSAAFLEAVIGNGVFPASAITVVEGPLFRRKSWPQGLIVLRGQTELERIIPRYDLLVTHFGITALQALSIGVPVILLNPSHYHRALGKSLEIPDIGVGRPRLGMLRAILTDPKRLRQPLSRFQKLGGKGENAGLAEFLERMPAGTGVGCPACGNESGKAAARFKDRTYRRCGGCGIIYLEGFFARPKEYGKRYFFKEYRKQYGRTYIEDFGSIRAQGLARIRIIRALLGNGVKGTIVDVGCAYGPFLDALRSEGYSPFGLDVSEEAVAYVKKNLKLPAAVSSFETIGRKSLPPGPILGLTMWYVVEHFRDLGLCLSKAASLIRPGGVLAFSTPNGSGISARKNLREFLRTSPEDHFSILTPRGISRILSRHGFILRKTCITGHHPERFPGVLGKAAERSNAARWILRAISRALRLGDTFEAFAIRGGTK